MPKRTIVRHTVELSVERAVRRRGGVRVVEETYTIELDGEPHEQYSFEQGGTQGELGNLYLEFLSENLTGDLKQFVFLLAAQAHAYAMVASCTAGGTPAVARTVNLEASKLARIAAEITRVAWVDRVGVKMKLGGRKAEWDPHRRAEALSAFNALWAKVKGAKKTIAANRRRRDWRERVKEAHPDVPDYVIDALREHTHQPKELAQRWAAESIGVDFNSYFERMVRLAKGEQLRK